MGQTYVCKNCFSDKAIQRYITANAVANECYYCGRISKYRDIAAPLDVIIALIHRCVEREWADANEEGIPFENGDWQGDVIHGWSLFPYEIDFPTDNGELQHEIRQSIENRGFCRINYYGVHPHEALMYSWDDFCQFVKHHARYLFLKYKLPKDAWEEDEHLIPSNKILGELSTIIMKTGLVRKIPAGTKYIRVRIHDSTVKYATVKELGPPPQYNARYSNRMSPAGIPMFYGATKKTTSILETIQKGAESKNMATVAIFETLNEFNVLDLTKLPKLPSFYDEENAKERSIIAFLRSFVEDVSTPIDKDGREHIEYVPTQIFTEYFRYLFRDIDDNEIHGILYPSSKNRRGICCVLFFTDKDCSSSTDKNHDKKWLSLDIKSLKTVNISKYYKNLP